MLMLMVLLAAIAIGALVWSQQRQSRAQLQQRDIDLARVSRVAEEDVTRFGEELQELHIDTLTTTLDQGMRQDYQRALDSYENAKALLAEAKQAEDVSEVTKALEDGRYAHACVLARQSGDPLPQRRPPCFFNPAHGPAQADVEWAPPGGVPREVPVCLADEERVKAGAEPDTRRVRDGNRMVPWYEGGPSYGAYANGYYGSYAMNGLFPGFLLGAMMTGWWGPASMPAGGEDWSSGDVGGGDGGGTDAGGDGGDFGGDGGGAGDGGGGGDWFGGGGDGGGWDFGGGDFGGF
jgi:hypothetical protein